jgi:hypothetical protein
MGATGPSGSQCGTEDADRVENGGRLAAPRQAATCWAVGRRTTVKNTHFQIKYYLL